MTMGERSSSERGNQPIWAVGVVIASAAIILGLIVIAYFEGIWTFESARIGTGAVAAIATIALALAIYYQGLQNQDIIDQNEDQIADSSRRTMILQESEWMPVCKFKQDSLHLRFHKNQPYNVRIRFSFEITQTEWYNLTVHEDRNEGWLAGIGDAVQELPLSDMDSVENGTMDLAFESVTESLYEYRYTITVNPEAANAEKISVISESRTMPWERMIV